MRVELYFDFSCPFAYLASREIEAIAARRGADLVWQPMLLGGVLRAIGSEAQLAAQGQSRTLHTALDQKRWAEVRGAPLAAPAAHPQRTVRALRTVLAVDDGPARVALIHGFYRAYWERGERIDDEALIRRTLSEAGVTGPNLERALAADGDPAMKDELRRRTDEAIARGVFGAPTAIAGGAHGVIPRDAVSGSGGDRSGGGHLLWGQDRLEQLEAILGGWDPASGTPPPGRATPAAGAETGATIEFWYDFSSPFSYLAATQVEAAAARAGARLSWRPMLLGALFKQIGQVNIPLFNLAEAKRRWMLGDLALWSSWLGVPFRFTSHFPQKTVTALRLALLAGDRVGELSLALFRAGWVEDRNLDDEATLRDILGRLDLDADQMLAQTKDPATKQALIDNTARAASSGIFGAPTFLVSRGGGEPRLYFGQDRLELAVRAASGALSL